MKFSIIVPVYGVAKYIRSCLESVVEQSYEDWECICVDDGSTDGSGTILDEFAKMDSRFRVVHKKNEGVAIARNTGLDLIHGDYYLFLDGDDLWHPELLRICKQVLDEFPSADIVSFKYQSFCNQVNFPNIREIKPNYHFLNNENMFDYSQIGFTAWTKAYKRSRFSELRQRHYMVGEDLLYLTQVYMLAQYEVTVAAELYGYRIYEGSTIRRKPSLRQAIDSISFKHDIVYAVASGGRKLAPQTCHWLSNSMTELFSYDYFYRVSPRKELRQVWKKALLEIYVNKDFSILQRLRMRIVACCPYWPVVVPLCWIPCWLKKKGVHR